MPLRTKIASKVGRIKERSDAAPAMRKLVGPDDAASTKDSRALQRRVALSGLRWSHWGRTIAIGGGWHEWHSQIKNQKPMANQKSRFRFRLRTLLAVGTVLTFVLGWIRWEVNQCEPAYVVGDGTGIV